MLVEQSERREDIPNCKNPNTNPKKEVNRLPIKVPKFSLLEVDVEGTKTGVVGLHQFTIHMFLLLDFFLKKKFKN